MNRPARQPAEGPHIGKAPSTGHPVRQPDPQEAPLTTTARPPQEPLVNFGGRVRESLRRRLRMYAAANDLDLQDILDQALTEFLGRQGA